MNDRKVGVLIPIYKKKLEWFEYIALDRVIDILKQYTIMFFAPKSLRFDYGEFYKHIPVIRFDNYYFKNISGYNQLMLSESFYSHFLNYQYILIYQLDAFVFSDQLDFFCSLGYDYIGAPWLYGNCEYIFRGKMYSASVGNGGFSLRKTKAFYNLLKDNADLVKEWKLNEDCFFSHCGKYNIGEFKIATKSVASKFSFEILPERFYKKNNKKLPFGCHAWMKFSKNFYKKIFFQCGIDLRFNAEKMQSLDCEAETQCLQKFFLKRIFKNGNIWTNILSYGHEWALFGLGEIGIGWAKILQQKGIIIKNIFDNDKNKQGQICLGIKIIAPSEINSETKILITSFNYEKEIMNQLENMGMVYGIDFISLKKEYAKRVCFFERFLM